MLSVRFYGRASRLQSSPRGPGQELIGELTQRGQSPLWEAGNPADAKVIEAIQRFDADDRYIVVEVEWEWRTGFLWLDTAHVVRYYRYDRHGREPWSPVNRGVLIKPEPKPRRSSKPGA